MNNLLNDLYNEMLSKNWNVDSINNKLNAMSKTLRLRESNLIEVQQMMANQTHMEELIEKMGKRLSELGITLKAFNDLDREISNYYEVN